jgi:hypothetical protein
LTEVAVWLEASLVARVLRSGPWLYPLVNLAHLLGIALLVGAIAALDLRLLGLWPEVPTAALARATVPVAGAGLALALLTGPALLAVRATEYVENPFLWAKFAAVAVGLANLGALHASAAWRSGDEADEARADGGRRRFALAGAVSLAAWVAAVSAGRMIAYW